MFRELIYLVCVAMVLSMCPATLGQVRDFDIPMADPPPVIDGQIDEIWSIASVQVLRVFPEPVGTDPTDDADLSGYFRVLYDPHYLYVLVDVNDSVLFNDTELANSWQDDSVEFYFDGDNSKGVQADIDDNDYQYRFGWNTEATFDAFEYFHPGRTPVSTMEGLVYQMAETDDGYLFEIAIPWTTLMVDGKIPHGQLIGIDCFINDDDDGGDTRETQIGWHATAGTGWNTPGQWGTAWIPPLLKATNPRPADGADDVFIPLLQWDAGGTAQFHDVYLGTSPDLGPDDLVSPRSPMAMYYHALGLESGATYYWRVDEIEKDGVTIHTGNVWSFSTPPLRAHSPNPPDGAKWVKAEDLELTWGPGATAQMHDIYFGPDEAEVAAGTGDTLLANQPQTKFSLPALEPATTYYWRVDEIDATGGIEVGQVWSFTTLDPEAGGGVKGEYYTNMTLSGVPMLVRVDPEIDFDWGVGGPGAPIGDDTFSVRWSGELEVAFDEVYTFTINTTDGGRLFIDGQLIINQWQDQRDATEASGSIALSPEVRYSLIMDYYENLDQAVAQLFWQSPSQPRQIVPAGALQLPLSAAVPVPSSGAVNVPQTQILRWNPGDKVAQHQVYFGDDRDAVAGATPASAGIYRGQQPADNTVYDPGPLEWNKTYYWRVDEVNAADADSPWVGNIWSFTTADFIVIDDFESYTDDSPDRIFQTWLDGFGYTEPVDTPGNGTNATVGYLEAPFAEQRIVHSGRQSMPMDYNNVIAPFYSEAERTWTTPQNWTVNGVDTLTLYVRGKATNTADTFYVAIEDSGGRVGVVAVADTGTVTAVQWTELKMAMSEFSGQGVSLTAVKKMYLGVGNRNAPSMGGAGSLFIDDIRVTKP